MYHWCKEINLPNLSCFPCFFPFVPIYHYHRLPWAVLVFISWWGTWFLSPKTGTNHFSLKVSFVFHLGSWVLTRWMLITWNNKLCRARNQHIAKHFLFWDENIYKSMQPLDLIFPTAVLEWPWAIISQLAVMWLCVSWIQKQLEASEILRLKLLTLVTVLIGPPFSDN